MSNIFQFNFVDLYENKKGILKYVSTVPVNNVRLTTDIITSVKSTIECMAIKEIKNEDFGILHNDKGDHIIFKIVKKEQEKNKSTMRLIIDTWIDIIDLNLKYQSSTTETEIQHIINVASDIQIEIDNYKTESNIVLPYFITSEVTTDVYKIVEKSNLFTAKELLTELLYSKNYTIKSYYDNYKVHFHVLKLSNTLLKLDLNDTTIFIDYTINYSDMEYNVLKLYDETFQDFYSYFRLKTNGKIEMLLDINTNQSVIVEEDGSFSTTGFNWESNILYPEKPLSKIISSNKETLEEALFEIAKTAYSDLKTQYFNHEITANVLYNSEKINLFNYYYLFSIPILLYINGQEISTYITRIEYGDTSAILKFGNVRTLLTDKLKRGGL